MTNAKQVADVLEALHDDYAVFNFAKAMSEKMKRKREEGRCGWWDIINVRDETLREMLIAHVEKDDWVDVANFAMMLFFREKAK